MKRFPLFLLLLLFLLAAAPREALADLVYEQVVTMEKLDFVKIDPSKRGGVDISKEDYGIARNAPKLRFTQRILLKGDRLKIRNSGGSTFIFDLAARTVTKLDRNAGTWCRVPLDTFLRWRAESELVIRRKRAANAKALILDIKNMIASIKKPNERRRMELIQREKLARLQKMADGVYEYKFIPPRGRSPYYMEGVFEHFKSYRILENGNHYITWLGTTEVDETPNRFYPSLALFPPEPSRILAERREFIAYMRCYYHFPDYSVEVHFHVKGFCKAVLPDELFRVPAGFKQVEERFETILEKF